MITIRVDDRDFNRRLKRLRRTHSEGLRRAMYGATAKMHRLAVHNAPTDDGKLKQNISYDVDTRRTLTGTVTSNAGYSAAVEEGTRPHTIRIDTKQVLAGAKRKAPSGWNSFSRDWAIYGKEVQHPGTQPRPFMYPAFKVGHRILIDNIRKMFKR